ncbi:DUF805 domain-containing protein [Henriciella litoralis]|uniref:DUF805 domain-containing protein n=1 Tax=Henriciella litoralis TaxID=568102 RepID=UPI0009FD7A91|nr:DUF805 domain-containing protein [Henriciella litoralis]
MSDATPQIIDPKRPWLTDERELPARMNWARTLFDPTGKSPRLHFTRAWTMLFAAQVIIVVLPFMVAAVLDMAGGDGSSVSTFGTFVSPIVFIVTTLMSYVIHSRRLNDADKPQLLALIPLLPLLVGMFLFFGTVTKTSTQYDKRYEMRQDFLENPEAFRLKQLEERKAAQEAAKASGKPPPQRRGGPGGPGGVAEPLPPKAGYVLEAAAPSIQMAIIPLSALIAVWSLLWVARVPFFGRYPGDPDFREPMPRKRRRDRVRS